MRTYKPTYFTSLPVLFVEFFIITTPGMLCLDLISAWQDTTNLGDVILSYLLVSLVFAVVIGILFLLGSLIAKLFAKKEALLSDTSITYERKSLSLHSIRYITLHLPETQSKYNATPMALYLWADNKNYIGIQRPSLRLVFQLKKNCPFALFSIHDIASRIKKDLVIGIVITVVFILLYFLK